MNTLMRTLILTVCLAELLSIRVKQNNAATNLVPYPPVSGYYYLPNITYPVASLNNTLTRNATQLIPQSFFVNRDGPASSFVVLGTGGYYLTFDTKSHKVLIKNYLNSGSMWIPELVKDNITRLKSQVGGYLTGDYFNQPRCNRKNNNVNNLFSVTQLTQCGDDGYNYIVLEAVNNKTCKGTISIYSDSV